MSTLQTLNRPYTSYLAQKLCSLFSEKKTEQGNGLFYILLTPNYFYETYPVVFIIQAIINIYKEITVLKATYMLMLFFFS